MNKVVIFFFFYGGSSQGIKDEGRCISMSEIVMMAYKERGGKKRRMKCDILAETDNFAVTYALAANKTLMRDFFNVLHTATGYYMWKTSYVDIGIEFAKELETYADFSKVTVREKAKGLVSKERYLALVEKYDEIACMESVLQTLKGLEEKELMVHG